MTDNEIIESAYAQIEKAKRLHEMAVASGPKIRAFAKRHPDFIDAYKNLRKSTDPEDRKKYQSYIDLYYQENPEDADKNPSQTKGTAIANAAANPMKSIISKANEGVSEKTEVLQDTIRTLNKLLTKLAEVGLADTGAYETLRAAADGFDNLLEDSETADIEAL